MTAPNLTRKVYFSVVEDVLSNVRESFLDEGVDEQVLQELKQLWESKLTANRALEPAEPEPPVQSSIPYTLIQQPQSTQQPHVVPAGTNVQQQIPMPVQISADGTQMGNAGMTFSGGMLPPQLQALVNVNPSAHLTLQQTANGQFILQAMPPGTQGQMVNLPQQTIIQAQPGQVGQVQQVQQVQQIQGQTLPQFDGCHDDRALTSSEVDTHLDKCQNDHTLSLSENNAQFDSCCDNTLETAEIEHNCLSESKQKVPESSESADLLLGACGGCIDIEFEASKALSKKLLSDLSRRGHHIVQLDGNQDTSSSEDDYDDDDDGNDDDDDKDDGDDEGEEEEPLNSGDDVSEEDPTELFDTDNVIVCQFEKITRHKSRWKFSLKDGIMNLDGKDHVFQKGIGEAEW